MDGRRERPVSLHSALRRVSANNPDPDAPAHRAVGVIVEWLREKAGTENPLSGVVLHGLADRMGFATVLISVLVKRPETGTFETSITTSVTGK